MYCVVWVVLVVGNLILVCVGWEVFFGIIVGFVVDVVVDWVLVGGYYVEVL